MKIHIDAYIGRFKQTLDSFDWMAVEELSREIANLWNCDGQLWLCGNGGSAENANHAANDFIYGLAPNGKGLKAHSLCANSSVVTCLANDLSYSEIYSRQLSVLAKKGDLLLIFSGSGNSENVLEAIRISKEMGLKTAGILGFSGGRAKSMLDIPIHFPVNDMQISEDLQMMVVHMIVQYLKRS